MEDTRTLGVSQVAVSESNRHSARSPTYESSSDLNRGSQTSLCNICAHGLRLDDFHAGGALGAPCDDSAPHLCFPFLEEGGKEEFAFGGEDYRWRRGAQYEPRDITPPDLPELSDECKFCRTVKIILLDRLSQPRWWTTTPTNLRLQVQYKWLGSKKEGCRLDFKLSSLEVEAADPEGFPFCTINFPISTSSGSCQEWLHITGRPLDVESSFSERNVNLIRSWLEQCNTDPSCCPSAKREKFLPTRLLDVGAQGNKNSSITLVDTQSMAQPENGDRTPEYICLSYRWGAAEPPLRTTNSTIEDYKGGILVDSMPRVFRDAVLVARTLGVRYLWIDALCIIQDCHGDWHNESAAMADVFSHSWLTIGAATTSSCHETLFYPRQDHSINIEFQSSIKRDIAGTLSILLLSEYFGSPLEESLKNSTWNTRGWVWQEQKLPKRLLIFGEKMLHFRRHRHLLHEYGRHYRFSLFENSEVSPEEPSSWWAVMCSYSRRELSKGSDRLAAISGFVKATAREFEDTGKPATYIAGIWLAESWLTDRQLLWLLEHPTISLRQLLHYHKDPKHYIAPSWSWASLNKPVDIARFGGVPVFKVVTHNIKPARSDPMVAIAPGSSITLLGKLRKVPARPSMGSLKSPSVGSLEKANWWEAPYSGDEKTWTGRRKEEQDVTRRIRYFLDWDPSTQDSAEANSEAHLKLFLLACFYDRSGRSAIGLILFPDAGDPSMFLRVGCFEIFGPWDSPDWKETEVVVI